MTGPAAAFTAVDAAADPAYLIGYLDRTAAVLAAVKDRMLALLEPAAGQTVLDVGCGTGGDARAVAALVGPSGRAVGLDTSRTMIQEARRRSAGAGPPVVFCVGDAQALPLPPAAVDACRAERVLQHLPDPARAVAEMARVTRPGGRVVVFEPDWDTLVLDHPDHALTRRFLDARSAILSSPRVGRQLPRLCAAAGLTPRTVVPVPIFVGAPPAARPAAAGTTALLELLRLPEAAERAVRGGVAGRAQADRWLTEVAAAATAGRFLAAMTGFLVAAVKPA